MVGAKIDWGGGRRPPTAAEAVFASSLDALVADLEFWLHEDDAGPWLLVSRDFLSGDVVCDALRLDYDGSGIVGGWSPWLLNGDDGARAEQVGVDLRPPDGIDIRIPGASPVELARAAAQWFAHHRATWALGPRARR